MNATFFVQIFIQLATKAFMRGLIFVFCLFLFTILITITIIRELLFLAALAALCLPW